MLAPRDYQEKALTAIDQAEREGVVRPLVVHPTGVGKTVTFCHAIARRADRGRSIVLVHREELAEQAFKKIRFIAPELTAGIVKATRNEWTNDVIIASVPTVSQDGRLQELIAQNRTNPFGTVIADEAHHAPSPSWVKTLTALGSFSPHGPLTVGFTATPERDGGKTLGVWEKVVAYMSMREAILGGHLVPILPVEVLDTKFDIANVRKGQSESGYSDTDAGRELEESGAIDQIADAYDRLARDRKGIVFTPTVKTAYAMAEALTVRGIAAEALDGTTPKDERKAILERLATGETRVVCNCGVLTEGFDEPTISCVVIARAARFRGLYIQMIGRGTRKAPGKSDLLILDAVGASERHEMVSPIELGQDLDESKTKKEDGEAQACKICLEPCDEPKHRCALCERYLPADRVRKTLRGRHENCQASGAKKVDVFSGSRMRWLPVPGGWCLGSGDEVLVMAPVGADTWKLATYAGGRIEVLHDELPVDWAMGIGEDRVKAFGKLSMRDAGWLRRQPSESQRSRLLREGVPEAVIGRVKTRGEAADLSTRIQGRRAMRKLGFRG